MAESNPFDAFDTAKPEPEVAAQGATPETPAVAPTAPPEDGSFIENMTAGVKRAQATDVVAPVATEAAKGVVEGGIINPLEFLGKSFSEVTGIRFAPETSMDIERAFQPDKGTSTVARMAHGVGQFIGAWVGPARVVKAAKGFSGMTARGALADMLGFDPHEARFGNLVESFPELSNPLSRFLAASPTDTDAEGRLKNALEGAMLGSVAEGIFQIIRGIKHIRSAKTEGEKAAIYEKEVQPSAEVVQAQIDEIAATPPSKMKELIDKLEAQSSDVVGTNLPAAKVLGREQPKLPKQADEAADVGATPHTSVHSALETHWALRDADKPLSDKANKPFRDAIEKELGKPEGWSISDQGGYKEVVKAIRETRELLPQAGDVPAATTGSLKDTVNGAMANRPAGLKRAVDEFSDEARGTTKAEAPASPVAPRASHPYAKEEPVSPRFIAGIAKTDPVEIERIARAIAQGEDPAANILPRHVMMNEAKWDSPAEALAVIQHIGKAVGEGISRYAQPGVHSLKQMQDEIGRSVADMVDGDIDLITANMRARGVAMKDAIAEWGASKVLMSQLARRVSQSASKIENGIDATERATMLQDLQMLVDVSTAVRGVTAQAARLTTAGRIRTGAENIPALLESLKKGGANDPAIRDLAYKLHMVAGNPKAMLRTIKTANTPFRIHNMVWRASLLANIDTHTVNMVSNFIHSAVMPIELAIGRFAQGAVHGELMEGLKGARDAMNIYVGMSKTIKDTLRMFGKVLFSKEGDPILDTMTKVDYDDQAQALIRLQDQRTAPNEIAKWAMRFTKTPFRLLSSEDEFFKQMTYRGHVYSQLWREASEQGLRGRQRAEFTHSNFEKEFSPTGRALNDEALRYAQKATYTTPHPKGSWGESIQIFAARHPSAQFLFVPFVRTPFNLVRRVWDWTPGLNMLHGDLRHAMLGKAGPEKQAEALGSISFGAMMFTGAAMLAHEGVITGNIITGFGDSATRYSTQKVKRLAGTVPYSAVDTDEAGNKTSVSYNRLDPFAGLVGIAADFVSAVRAGADGATLEEIAAIGIVGMSQNFLSKTYMRGLSDLLRAIDSPGGMATWFKNRAASYVPGIVGQVTQANDTDWAAAARSVTGAPFLGKMSDPYMRETRDAIDAIMARIPGLSHLLPPQMNWFTGEPIPVHEGAILPKPSRVFAMGTESDKHPAMIELGRINYPGREPDPIIGNVRLNPEQEHRFRILMAKPPGVTPMIERLRHVIESPRYQKMKDIDPTFYARQFGEGDPRHDLIRTEISKYRERAIRLLAKEFPELGEQLRDDRTNKLKKRVGRTDLKELLQRK